MLYILQNIVRGIVVQIVREVQVRMLYILQKDCTRISVQIVRVQSIPSHNQLVYQLPGSSIYVSERPDSDCTFTSKSLVKGPPGSSEKYIPKYIQHAHESAVSIYVSVRLQRARHTRNKARFTLFCD